MIPDGRTEERRKLLYYFRLFLLFRRRRGIHPVGNGHVFGKRFDRLEFLLDGAVLLELLQIPLQKVRICVLQLDILNDVRQKRSELDEESLHDDRRNDGNGSSEN